MRAHSLVSAAALLGFTAFATPVRAEQAPSAAGAAPAQAQRAVYRKALQDGRSMAERGDLAGAMARLQDALRAAPDDPAALSELGLVALRQKDYRTAEDATRRAVAGLAGEGSVERARLRGATLYNLGLILEAQGNRAAAVEAYVASLAARQNRAVRARLAVLDAKAAAGADPLAPVAMRGPFPSFEEFCARVEKPDCLGPEPETAKFECHGKPAASVAKGEAPYRAVRVYASTCKSGESLPVLSHHVAVQTQAGWWFTTVPAFSPINPNRFEEQRAFPEVVIKDLIPGGAKEVLVRVTASGTSSNALHLHVADWDVETWLLVGVGPSGQPSAASIPIAQTLQDSNRTVDDDRYSVRKASTRLVVRFAPEGLEISGQIVGDVDGIADRAALLGRHRLMFP